MNGGKPAGPELEEGPGRAGKATRTIQSEYTIERPGWDASQDGKAEPSRAKQDHWEGQWQEFLKTLQPLHTGGGSLGLSETSPWDDAKAFLASFEQVAKACQWPGGEWAARLLPALSGEAEEAFRSLETRDQEDYGKVKAAILRGEALRREAQRQHFRQFCCQEVRDPRRIHSQVQELCWQWLKPERHSKEEILELLILEQFLASLPVGLQGWIRARGPDTCSQAVALAEDFLMIATLQGPLKEEFEDSLEAEEEPSDPVRGQIYKEPERNGSGINFQRFASSSLLPEGQGMEQTDEKEEVTKLHGSRLSLQIVSQSLPRPALQTTVWQVLQEDGGNVEPSGDKRGSWIKMENSQFGGNEPQDTSRTAPQISQVHVLEIAEMQEEGSREGQEKQAVKREDEWDDELTGDLTATVSPPSEVHAGDNMPMFSKYGRRYRYKLHPDMVDAREDCDETRTSEESLQQNSCSDQSQRTIRGGRKPEFSENDKEGNWNQGFQSEERPYECSHCSKCFSQREQLIDHQQLHTGEKRYKCLQCETLFTSRQGLVRHQDIHTGSKQYKCSQCGRCFRERNTLKTHQRTHTGEKPFKCSHCGRCFSQLSNLYRHRRIHTGEKPYKCSECGKCYGERRSLKKHQNIHIVRKASVRECISGNGEEGNRNQGLQSEGRPYECSHCSRCFSQKEQLMNHQQLHIGERRHKCLQRGKVLTSRRRLARHQETHTESERYKCSQCGRCFSEGSTLKRHQRSHTGEKPFQCSLCGRCFSQEHNLKRHRRIHSGEKPFKCSECGKCYGERRTLKKHQRIHSDVLSGEQSFSQRGHVMDHQRTQVVEGTTQLPFLTDLFKRHQ